MKRASLLPALALVLTSIAWAQPQRFALAIARFDGRLVPFAAYDNSRWQRAWPEANEGIDVDGKPKPDLPTVWRRRRTQLPTVWHVWPASGGHPLDAHVKGLEVVDAHCLAQVALVTDLPEIKAEHPLKFGVATDSPVPLGPIQAVQASGPGWSTAERVVRGSFSALEAQQAQKPREAPPRESPPPRVKITELYREADTPESPMYFVAEKQYRTARSQNDRGCGAVTVMTGWLVLTQAETWVLWDPRVFITDCDAMEVRTGLPLASLHVSGRLFWILQEHGYEDETYIVAEIGPSAIHYRIEVNGGGC